ncbi:MAG: hypothetical protein HOV66_22080 [Streptomycetaceae bacterium]|nr:hypothetical protein [Streptomycetaceae bacterium]
MRSWWCWQTVASLAPKPEVAERVNLAIDDLDATIRDIRGAIFELRTQVAGSLRAEVRRLVDECTEALGFRPALRIVGPVDSAVPPALHGDVLAVVREALSNVVRHARAETVEVAVAVAGSRLTVTIADNGCGAAIESSGLANTRERARRHGGDVELHSPVGAGTKLIWDVPL